MAQLGCGEHQVEIRDRGGQTVLLDLTEDKIRVSWTRVRDDISSATIVVNGRGGCCDQLGQLETGYHEVHIFRSGVKVWEGILTRIEYETDMVDLYASDILWVAKNTVLPSGYDYSTAGSGAVACGWHMERLLRDWTFAPLGDKWNGAAGVQRQVGPKEPKTSKAAQKWSMTTWEDFDKFAEDHGMDYSVIGRQINFWDTQYRWRTIEEPLRSEYCSNGFAIVEYGNEFATRVVVTNGNGYGSMRAAPAWAIAKYGYIDHVVSGYNKAAGAEVPSSADLVSWGEQAAGLLSNSFPQPVRVRVSENTVLTPQAPYDINDLVAGSWMKAIASDLCRTFSEEQWHKLDRVFVTEDATGENVTISTLQAPEEELG